MPFDWLNKAMLTGKELGDAIRAAIKDNGKTAADAARYFGVKPPSVTGWMNTGRIGKGRFDELVAWLDKTPRSYWGLMEIAPLGTPDSSAEIGQPVGKIPSSKTLDSCLRDLGDYLSVLDEGERDLAGVLLAQLAKRPDDYQRVARMIQGSIDAANAAVETGRRQKFISSGGQ